jgi:peptidoglycan hydrolase-like protein with peptidoglycan-binding domain
MFGVQSVWNAPAGNAVMDQIKVKTVSQGSSGTSVKILQNALLEIGRGLNIKKSGGADGSFGKNTKKDLIEFQALMGLKADGIAGSNTWNALARSQNAQRETAFPPQNLIVYSVSGSVVSPSQRGAPTPTPNLPAATSNDRKPFPAWVFVPIALTLAGIIAFMLSRKRKGKRK